MRKWTISKLFMLAMLLLSEYNSSGQIIFQDIRATISQHEMMDMLRKALLLSDSLDKERKDHHKMFILYRDEDLLLLSDGFFDVFLWKNKRWKEVSNKRKGGYNFSGKKFVWHKRIFSYGGYGYWQDHGDLIEFDLETGNWNKINLPVTLPFAPAIITDVGLKVFSDSCFIVNLSSLDVERKKLQKPKPLDKNMTPASLNMESASWEFLFLGKENYLYEKKNNKLYYSDLFTTGTIDKSFFAKHSLIQFKNDSLIKWEPEGNMVQAIDIRDLLRFYKPIYLQVEDNGYGSLFGYLSVVILLGGSFGYWFIHRNNYKNHLPSWQNTFIPVFIKESGKILNTEDLDKLLELEEVASIEYKKYKRSKMLSEINGEFQLKCGRDLVVRSKDPKDGRRFIYEIDLKKNNNP